MRWFKKIVRAILALLPVFAVFFLTSPTYALRYDVDSFIINRFYQLDPYSSSYSTTPTTSYVFSEDIIESSSLKFRNSSTLSATYNSTSGKCEYSNYLNPGYYRSDNQHLEYTGGPFYYGYSLSYFDTLINSGFHNSDLNNFRCKNMLAFGSSSDSTTFSVPEFDTGTIPLDRRINATSMLPYHYMFSNLYFNTDRVVDGLHYTSGFDLSELLPQEPHSGDGDDDRVFYTSKIKSASFNLNFNSSLEKINAGSSVVFDGSFVTGSSLSSSSLSSLDLKFYLNHAGSQYSSICYISQSVENSNQIDYSCSLTNSSQYDFNSYIIYMVLSSSASSLSVSDHSWNFNNIYITINGDSTYGGYGGISQTGSFPNVAPGSSDVHNQVNYNASLSSLFGFSFLNPFGGLFALFSDSSSCVSIPIIAGMLNAEETSYCPWFSSETRSILTPVLGVVGLMLVFGFAVRWLGSSSGNMFEDQTSHKWGNTQIKQKGVK